MTEGSSQPDKTVSIGFKEEELNIKVKYGNADETPDIDINHVKPVILWVFIVKKNRSSIINVNKPSYAGSTRLLNLEASG